MPALSFFNDDAMRMWSRWTYHLPYSVFAVDTLLYAVNLTFDLVILTSDFDLKHLQRIACEVTKLCTVFERNRTIRGGVIAISEFDLMTVNIALRVALGSGIIFTNFDLRQLIRAWIIAFYADTLLLRCYLDLWPVDLERSWYCQAYVTKVCTKFERNLAMKNTQYNPYL